VASDAEQDGGAHESSDPEGDRIAPEAAVITTVAGTGHSGFSGDGGAATQARLSGPMAVAVTADGGFLIADADNHRIRQVALDGTIRTVAGTGDPGFSGDGGPARNAQLKGPCGIAVTPDGGFLIADMANSRIRRVAPDGTIMTLAGRPYRGAFAALDAVLSLARLSARFLWGDGGPAIRARLGLPVGVAMTADGGFLIADLNEGCVRRVAPDGTIATAAGSGKPIVGKGAPGDRGPATEAAFSAPYGVAVTGDGEILISDRVNCRVRKVGRDGRITTVAGTGDQGSSTEGGPATRATLDGPAAVAVTRDGGFLIADAGANRVRRVTPHGTIMTVAGVRRAGFSGDGGPATSARLNAPVGLAVTLSGGFLIADRDNHRIRSVDVPDP
jgi:DNA-binding beta-propeller fold protein YncE